MPIIIPPPSMVTAPFRMGYTTYKRHRAPDSLPLAVNAIPFEKVFSASDIEEDDTSRSSSLSSSNDSTSSAKSAPSTESSSQSSNNSPDTEDFEGSKINRGDNEELPAYTENELELTDSDITNERVSTSSTITRLIAMYPQYLTTTKTTITIREVDFPRLGSSFTVHVHPGNTTMIKDFENLDPIFNVRRERPSLTHRQIITDASTNAPILTVRKDLCTLPHSYRFDDPSDNKILDLRGSFSIPTQGLRAHALFTNNINITTGSTKGEKEEQRDNGNVKLFMQGSWRNRHAVIRDAETKEVLAVMSSETLNLRSMAAGRRTYTVTIREGVDMVVVTGMIVALDERA